MVAKTSKGAAVVTLPTETQILITREFNAPRRLVYRAWTTPELIKRWWNAKRGQVIVADVDLRVGGTWRWVMLTEDGTEVAFHGVYRELVPDERIVYTEVFEGVPGGGPSSDEPATLNTITLTEQDGRTMLTSLTDAMSQELRDLILATGMEAGMQDAMDLLEEVAVSLL